MFGADVHVLEKFRTRQYKVDNLYVIDDAHTFKIPNTDIRLLGLGMNDVFSYPLSPSSLVRR